MVKLNTIFNNILVSISSLIKLDVILRKSKTIIIFLVALTVTLLLDNIISNVPDFLGNNLLSSYPFLSFFIVLFAVLCIGNYIILKIIKNAIRNKKPQLYKFDILYKIVKVTQTVLLCSILLIVLEIFIFSYYNSILLFLVTIISYILSISMFAILSERFFSWYRSNKSSFIVLLYGFASTTMVVSLSLVLIFSVIILFEKSPEINPSSEIIMPSFEPGLLSTTISDLYGYFSIISFCLFWISNTVLLYFYSKRIGKRKYWLLSTIPLLYFIGTFVSFFNLYYPSSEAEKFWYFIFISLNSTTGGFLFAITFLILKKRLPPSNSVKEYFNISALGFLLFFINTQATVISASFPPFGIMAISFVGLSSYMILIGIYYIAISLSQDLRLRKFIDDSIEEEDIKFLNSISKSEKEKELEKKINRILQKKESMEKEIGIQSSMTDKEIRDFFDIIIKEKNKK